MSDAFFIFACMSPDGAYFPMKRVDRIEGLTDEQQQAVWAQMKDLFDWAEENRMPFPFIKTEAQFNRYKSLAAQAVVSLTEEYDGLRDAVKLTANAIGTDGQNCQVERYVSAECLAITPEHANTIKRELEKACAQVYAFCEMGVYAPR